MRLIVFLLLLCGSIAAYANSAVPIVLEKVKINLNDRAALLRGAKFYASNCMVCHSMKYLAYNKLAQKAGITLDKMPVKDQEWWLGIVPPDLSLIAKVESPDWLYTYLHAFYKDPSRPTGYNNLLVKNVNMTNILLPYQGEQVLVSPTGSALTELGLRKPHYYTVLKLVRAGSMSPEEYNQTMTDLVNFLVYASDPTRSQREYAGIWVIGFLIFLGILAFFLKKAYWKDVEEE